MSSPAAAMQDLPATTPCQTMRGHTDLIRIAVHLPDGRRIITCSDDGSLRLWDLVSGVQIGDDWRDEENGEAVSVSSIALSPNGITIASGSGDGTVRLWDVETGKVIAKWVEDSTNRLPAVCWSADGQRVLSGSESEMAREWDVETGKTVLGPIETDHHILALIYSPDNTKFATGGQDRLGHGQNGIKIWNAKTGELLTTLEHGIVLSLAWTSDGKKLISGSHSLIRICDTVPWPQQLSVLKGHTDNVNALSLSPNDRLLASASDDKTARLWDLNTNLPVGPILQHEKEVTCAAFSADGKLLVTGCEDNNLYVWNVYTILKDVGLEYLLSVSNVTAEKSLTDAEDTRGPAQLEDTRPPLQGFRIDDTPYSVHSSAMHHHPNTDDTPPLQQRSRQNSMSHLGRDDTQGPAQLEDARPLLQGYTIDDIDDTPDIIHSSATRQHLNTDETPPFEQCSRTNSISYLGRSLAGFAAVQDKGALYVAPRPERALAQPQHTHVSSTSKPPHATATPGAAGVQSHSITIDNPTRWTRFLLFVCCVSARNHDS